MSEGRSHKEAREHDDALCNAARTLSAAREALTEAELVYHAAWMGLLNEARVITKEYPDD